MTAPEKITLPAQLARDLLEAGIGCTIDGWTVVADQEEGHARWEAIRSLIIRRDSDGLFFAGDYRQGLTEYQDTQPWEYETEATFGHVVPVTRVEYVTPEAAARTSSALPLGEEA